MPPVSVWRCMTYVAWKIDTANDGIQPCSLQKQMVVSLCACVCVCSCRCVCVFLLHERSKPSAGKYRQAETDRLPCSMCLLQSTGACTVSRCVPGVSDSFFLRVRFTVYICVIDQTSRNCSFPVI